MSNPSAVLVLTADGVLGGRGWRGVVLVAPRGRFFTGPADETERWGANGLEAGPLPLLGDEALLKRFAAALAE